MLTLSPPKKEKRWGMMLLREKEKKRGQRARQKPPSTLVIKEKKGGASPSPGCRGMGIEMPTRQCHERGERGKRVSPKCSESFPSFVLKRISKKSSSCAPGKGKRKEKTKRLSERAKTEGKEKGRQGTITIAVWR